MDNPKVSIYIPMYNSARFIKETVQSCLDQTYTDFELLLIDDCSTDNTLEIVESIKDDRIVIIKSDKNQGIAATSNIAIENARGEYIARLDHDDLMFPDRIKIEVEYLDNNSDIVMVGGNIQIKHTTNSNIDISKYDNTFNLYEQTCELLYGMLVTNSTTMYRRDFIINNNIRHNIKYRFADDFQFFFDITKMGGRIQNLPNVLITRIEHENNATNVNWPNMYLEILEIQRKVFRYIFDNYDIDEFILYRKIATNLIFKEEPQRKKEKD